MLMLISLGDFRERKYRPVSANKFAPTPLQVFGACAVGSLGDFRNRNDRRVGANLFARTAHQVFRTCAVGMLFSGNHHMHLKCCFQNYFVTNF